MNHVIIVLSLASLSLLACSKSDKSDAPASSAGASVTSAAFKGSCNKKNKTSKCDEYQTETLGLEEGACKELGGVYGKSSCPTDGRLGTCKMKSGNTTYYYATTAEVSYTAATAKEDCEDPITEGKFTPAAAPPAAAPAAAAGGGGNACEKLAAQLCADEPAKCAARKAWLDKSLSKGRKGEAVPEAEQQAGCKGVLDDAAALAGYQKAAKKAVK